MTQDQFLFLVGSAMGATIILSRGDIFRPFREWILKKSIKHKGYIHDFTIPDPVPFDGVIIDHKTHDLEHKSYVAIISEILGADIINWSTEESKNGYRHFMYCKSSHGIVYIKEHAANLTANVYERIIYKPFIKYISEMLNCPQCAGIWVGCVWYGTYLLGAMNYWGWRLFCFGCITSAVAYLYFKLYSFLEKK